MLSTTDTTIFNSLELRRLQFPHPIRACFSCCSWGWPPGEKLATAAPLHLYLHHSACREDSPDLMSTVSVGSESDGPGHGGCTSFSVKGLGSSGDCGCSPNIYMVWVATRAKESSRFNPINLLSIYYYLKSCLPLQ